MLGVTLQPGELRTTDWPAVTLHENGCVRVHRPAWYRSPGDFELTLPASELDALMATRGAVAGIDVAALSRRIATEEREVAARAASGEPVVLHAAEGVDISRFDLGNERRFAWVGLEQDAAVHPQFADIATLRSAQRALIALLDDDRAVPVKERAP